jgi:hypothetical protein
MKFFKILATALYLLNINMIAHAGSYVFNDETGEWEWIEFEPSDDGVRGDSDVLGGSGFLGGSDVRVQNFFIEPSDFIPIDNFFSNLQKNLLKVGLLQPNVFLVNVE